ncbi:MAG TPA: hypothetical protein VFU49_13875 [Ktedonobacteraceae bacterium]|nr:hypothetical protein [Ktedonobacteraceae bacterium]
MSGDRKRLQGTSKVSRAIWPERVQWNPATGKIAQWRRAMIVKWFYQPGTQRPRKHKCTHKSRPVASSQHWRIPPLKLRIHRRIVLSLPIVGVLLVVCIWQHWYVQLILATLCTMTNVLIFHFLFNDGASVPSVLPGRSPVSLPAVAPTTPSVRPHSRPLPTMTFPETPMPATPLIRVLETIDLSSTDVEHFLKLEEQAQRTEASPPPQESPQQHPE